MPSHRDYSLTAWTTFILAGLLLPFFAMLAFGWNDLENRVGGMISYATICLPGFVVVASVVGEQLESGRMPTHVHEFAFLFILGVILLIFIGVSVTGIIGTDPKKIFPFAVKGIFLVIQLVATVVVVLASARIKAGLTRR